jgi:hypothetical protein
MYCASPAVVERPPSPNRPNPTFALGFVVNEERSRATARKFIRGSSIFAPSAFRSAEPSDIRGVYIPAYLYTARAHSSYAAEIGENYQVTVTYTTMVNGKTVTRTRTETRTEWRSLEGQHATYVSDHVVTASRGLTNAELEAVEPFDLRALHRYDAKIVSGWAAEEPSMLAAECTALARHEAIASIGRALGRFMPGDSYRGLRYQTQLSAEHLELLLMPVWVLAVRYSEKKPLVRLVVNGQTGRIFGKAPISKLKVTLAVLAVVVPIVAAIVAFVVKAAMEGRL